MSQTSSSPEQQDPQLSSVAVDAGLELAARMFTGKASANVERHLSREQIAAILTIAFEKGARWQAQRSGAATS